MTVDAGALAIILAGAALTFLTRIGGPWLIRTLRLGPAMDAALQAMPGAVLAAITAPAALSRPADAVAAVTVLALAPRLPTILVVAIGVGTAVLLRRLTA